MSNKYDVLTKNPFGERQGAVRYGAAVAAKVNYGAPRPGILEPVGGAGRVPTYGGAGMRPVTSLATEAYPDQITGDEILAAHPDVLAEYGDIDGGDIDDPQAVSIYVNEIYAYLRVSEGRCKIPNYLTRQSSIDARARAKLVDWMCGVHRSFSLANESIFHAIQILDRFLAQRDVSRTQLELLGISILYLSSKFEESYTPSMRHFVDAVKGRYTRRQISQMEAAVLAAVSFNLSYPTSITFMRRYAKVMGLGNRERYMAFCLAELCLHDAEFITARPSHLAAACIVAAKTVTGVADEEGLWPTIIERYSGYTIRDFDDVTGNVMAVVKRCRNTEYTHVMAKYSKSQYYDVAGMLERAAGSV